MARKTILHHLNMSKACRAMALVTAWISKSVADNHPYYAEELDDEYRDLLELARIHINHAIKIRKERKNYGYQF